MRVARSRQVRSVQGGQKQLMTTPLASWSPGGHDARNIVDQEEQALGGPCRAWEAVRRAAPTGPHHVASRRPPGNLLSALPLTVLDHSCDRMDAGAHAVPLPVAALGEASHVLAGVAGAVEHVPQLRRGERAETRA